MKYIVYLTTNLKSKIGDINKIYIGVHKTNNPEIFDGYLGCGVYINKPSTYMYPKTPFQYAVKKYGVNAFRREILYIYDNSEDAFNKEAELVNSDFIKLDHTYNVSQGGKVMQNVDPRKHSLPLYQFDLCGNLVKFWECTLDAEDFYGYDYSKFNQAISGRSEFLNSYWSRTNEIDINLYGNHLLKPVYLYTNKGKLLYSFGSRTECANFLECAPQSISNAIRNNNSIKGYYASDSVLDEYIPKPRKCLQNSEIFVYSLSNGYLGKFKGKAVMPIIGLYSFSKISKAINDNRGWYKDFYLSLNEVESIPEKYTHNRRVEVYDKNGNLLEILNTVKEVKEKYQLNSAEINRILKGIKQHKDYIFKYSK